MIKLVVRQNRVGPVRGRHPWVFSGALTRIPDGLDSGMPVALTDEAGKFLAQGYFNSYSQIAVRVWSWDEKEGIDTEFFEKRIKQAYEIRKSYVESKATDSYRLVNSENDLLPGLIVDKYADYLCVQFHTRGMEFWKTQIVDALTKVVEPKGIYERSDVYHRRLEDSRVTPPYGGVSDVKSEGVVAAGQTEASNLLFGSVPEKIKIKENGLKFLVDIVGGQKTGFFLDQRDKRQALMKYCKDKNVLNCFSYTGGFSIYALEGGAEKVASVDVSDPALKLAEENMKLNGFKPKQYEFICADVKAYLTCHCEERSDEAIFRDGDIRFVGSKSDGIASRPSVARNDKFDIIILDPPAFIKDRHKIKEGVQGYRRINEMAIRILPPGGILVSASCSAHLSLSDFRYMLSEAAGRAGRTLQILETYTHGIDHPELVAFTEGEYLKCVFAIVR